MKIVLKEAERTCGDCTLCCKVLGVKELEKPTGQYCQHAVKSKGCGIYDSRPETCRSFRCMWLMGLWPMWAKPNKVHGVPGLTDSQKHFIIWEDPGYPGVASEELKDVIKNLIADGTRVVIVGCGDKRTIYGNPAIVDQTMEAYNAANSSTT
jgi:hypothetical protein